MTEIIISFGWQGTAILLILATVSVYIITHSVKSLTLGSLNLTAKTDEDLEARVAALEKEILADKLEARIQDEFATLRRLASGRRKMFGRKMSQLYRGAFSLAWDELIPTSIDGFKSLSVRIYTKNVLLVNIEVIGPEMLKLVFENNFKPIPDCGTDTLTAKALTEDFYKDVSGKAYYLLTLSLSRHRDEWDYPFSLEVYEKSYLPAVEADALREAGDYFWDVISARDAGVRAMYSEYGKTFHSYDSFKRYVEKRYKEIY